MTVGSLTSEEHLWIGTNAVEAPVGGLNGSDTGWSFFLQGTSNNWGSGVGLQPSARAGYTITTSTTETYDRTTLDAADRVTVLVAFREATAAAGAVLDPIGMRGFFGA